MHGICGEVEDPDDGNEMYRICHSCATKKKAQTSPPLSNPPKCRGERGLPSTSHAEEINTRCSCKRGPHAAQLWPEA